MGERPHPTGYRLVVWHLLWGQEKCGFDSRYPDQTCYTEHMDTFMFNGRTCVNLPCSYCGVEVTRRITHVGNNVYCSEKCKGANTSSAMILSCSRCNKDVRRTPAQIARSTSGRVFCSRNCSTAYNNQFKSGPTHGNWKDGRGAYRKVALRHYPNVCSNQNCPLTAAGSDIPVAMLDVDHIDGDRKNSAIENLQVLCVWCHALKTRGVSTP